MNTTWRQTIECYRSARPHWTAGTNDLYLINDTWYKWLWYLEEILFKKTNKSISSAVWTSTQNGNALGSQEISPLRKGPCKPAQANRKVHWVKSNPTLQKPSKWTTLITKPRKCVDMQKTLIGLMCNSVSGESGGTPIGHGVPNGTRGGRSWQLSFDDVWLTENSWETEFESLLLRGHHFQRFAHHRLQSI